MITRSVLLSLFIAAAFGGSSAAHVVSYGRTDVMACAEHAANKRSSNVKPCNRALATTLSKREKVATLVNRGIIHRRNGDLQLALDDFNAAVDLSPELPEAYLNRGTLYYLAGYQDRAIRDYEKALALGIEHPWLAWYNIGVSYEEKGDKAKAREAYQNALAARSAYSPARERLAVLDND